jgi:hypothetical protein
MFLPQSPAKPDAERGCGFEVALIYEDVEAGKRGKCFCDMLSAAIRPGIDTHYKLCNFQMLKTLEGRSAAAECAGSSDLVIISTSSGKGLPASVKEWLEMWIGMGDTAGPALAAVFATRTQATRLTCDYLQSLATSGGIEFFPYTLPGGGKRKGISNRGRQGLEKIGAVRGVNPRARAGSSGVTNYETIHIV